MDHAGAGDATEDLAFLARALLRRRRVLAGAMAAGLVAGGLAAAATPTAYDATAVLALLVEGDVVEAWLRGDQAALAAAPRLGAAHDAALGVPGEGEGKGLLGHRAAALQERVAVEGRVRGEERLLSVRSRMPDALAARDVAAAYVAGLEDLRAVLEASTRTEAFRRYYNGNNQADAEEAAGRIARNTTYWILVDAPDVPLRPAEPQPAGYMGVGLAVGGLGGLAGAFAMELGRWAPGRGSRGPGGGA